MINRSTGSQDTLHATVVDKLDHAFSFGLVVGKNPSEVAGWLKLEGSSDLQSRLVAVLSVEVDAAAAGVFSVSISDVLDNDVCFRGETDGENAVSVDVSGNSVGDVQ